MKQFYFFRYFLLFLIGITTTALWGQTTFNYTGGMQTYTVPPGITSIQIESWGAQGQSLTIEDYNGSIGGFGGYSEGELNVAPGQVLNIYVGGMGAEGLVGYNGGQIGGYGTPSDGDEGYAGSGGGASDVRVGGNALTDRVIVAGGGGGGGRDYVNGTCQPCGMGGDGGAGGGFTGLDGSDPTDPINNTYFNPGSGGKGGTASAGGLGGNGTQGVDGNAGQLGVGGVGINGNYSVASGGGGGGYYGGGSGAGANSGSGAAGAGGAGGSSYIGGVTNGSTTPGIRTGNGQIVITPLCNAPVATCQDITIQLDATGNASITAAQIDNGSIADCGIASLSVSPSSFDCSNVGANTVTLTVTDNNGGTATCTATVTVQDLVPPTPICQDITVQLGADGTVTIDASQVDNGSNDACGIFFIGLDETEFTCADIGANTVTLGVIDNNFNSASCTATVTVEDTMPPLALCQDITVQLDASGSANITAGDIDNGSSDNCNIASMSLSQDTFSCADVGNPVSVTLTVTDDYMNSSTCTATVTVEDNVPPTAICEVSSATNNIMVNGSFETGDFTGWTAIDNPSPFLAYGVYTGNSGVGFFPTALPTDGSRLAGNGFDGDPGEAVLYQDIMIPANSLNASLSWDENIDYDLLNYCNGCQDRIYEVQIRDLSNNVLEILHGITAYGGQIDNDNVWSAHMSDLSAYAGQTIRIAYWQSIPESFTGPAKFSLDNVRLDVSLGVLVELDATGNASITAGDIDDGSSDACGIQSMSVSPSDFTCTDVGDHTVTLTVTDNNGNVSTCDTTVTVADSVAPEALCNSFTVQLDANGNASITVAEVDNGSNDACGIASTAIDIDTFDCGDVGDNQVVLTVTDTNGNVSTCTATVTVEDNVAPEAICQDLTVQLDASGNANITAAQIDNGSNDACGIASLALDKTDFTCADVTSTTDQVWINEFHYDNSGGDVGEFIEVAGTAGVDLAGYSLVLYNGSNGTDYNTVPLSGTLDDEGSGFGALDFAISGIQNGAPDGFALVDPSNMVVEFLSYEGSLTANSGPANGLSSTDVGINEPGSTPIGDSLQRVGSGTSGASFSWSGPTAASPGSVNAGQTFATGVGVTLSVTDNNGNVSTCTATVTVIDNVAPDALCQPYTAQLDATGTVTITAADIDNGSSDACGIASMSVSPDTFTCEQVGTPQGVTLTVTDKNGNESTCTTTVTVEDNIAPEAVCISGGGGIVTNTVTTSPGLIIDGGDVVSIITITDDITLTDLDVILDLPHEWTSDLTITLESPAGTTLTLFDDGCSGDDLIMTLDDEAVNDLSVCATGSNPAYPDPPYQPSNPLSIFDGESSLGSWILTVNDSWSLSDDGVLNSWGLTYTGDATASALDVVLDATGNASITADQIDAGSTDACGIDTISVSPNTFDCSNVGDNTVTLTVTDVNGNSSTCTSIITVLDNTPPVASCQPLTVYLDVNGNVSITPAAVDNGSTDACGIADLSLDIMDFSCPDIGDNTVTLTVTDVNGNSSTCESIITVIDDIAPVITCPDDMVVSNDAGVCEAFVMVPQPTVVDNCIGDPCAPITDAGTNVGGPTWDRPFSFNNISGAGPVAYSLFTFTVVASGDFDINSIQDFDGYLHLYENSFDPLDQFTNLIALNDDGNGGIGTSDIEGIALTAGTTYILVTSGWGAGDEGNFVTTITMDCGSPQPVPARRVVTQNYENYNGIRNIEEAKRAWLATNRVSFRTIDLNAYRGVGEATYVNDFNGTSDASGVYPVGTTDVVWTVTDPSGNSDTCTMQVTVEDNEAPIANCQPITVQLDETGSTSITADQIDNGSTDNCGIDFMTVIPNSFDCGDVGDNTVTLTVTDIHGNSSTCDATVTVEDNVPPVVMCSDILVQLDENGEASISTDNFQSVLTISGDNSSGDPGTTDFTVPIIMGTTITFDWHYTTPDGPEWDTFGFLLNGAYTELTNVNDGNDQSGTMSVLLAPGDIFGFRSYTLDNIVGASTTTVNNFLPSFSGQFDPSNWTLTLENSDGTAFFQPIATDACGIADLSLDIEDFSCADIGENTVTITATDNNGNQATCSSIVTIEDSLAPVPDVTDLPALADYCSVELPENTATDNCAGSVVGIPNIPFPITDPGTVLVTWTYEDAYGNISTQTQYVTIYDPADPAWQDVDSDGDGYTNGEELAMGSDPCDICDPGPAIPTGPADQLFCTADYPDATLADIDVTAATDHTLNYYDAAGNPLQVTDELVSGTYVITQTNVNDCESHTGLLVTVTVSETPVAILAESPQVFCSADMTTIADLAISGVDAGNIVTWYDSVSLTGELSEATALVDGMTYYVTQTNNDTCESAATAITVTVSINPEAPTGPADQLFCSSDYPTPTFGDLDATGADTNTLHYYDTAGNEYSSTDTLVSGTYSITQTNEFDCESTSSLLVNVTVSETPATILAESPQVFCSADMPTIADIAISGIDAGNIVTWYDSVSLTGELSEATALVDGMTYFVTQTNDDTCESAATAITVTVSINPEAPTGPADQLFCSSDYPDPTMSDIDATASDDNVLHYYDSVGNELDATDSLVSGTYSITQTNEYGCESMTSLLVEVTVSETPGAPVGPAEQLFCSVDEMTVGDLEVAADLGNYVTWYDAETGGDVLDEAMLLETGMYYASQTNPDTCESVDMLAVSVTVTETPDAPEGDSEQSFCASDYPTVGDLSVTADGDNTITWYDAAGNELNLTDELQDGVSYYATQTTEAAPNCESEAMLAVVVEIVTVTIPTGEATQEFCVGDEATVADLVAIVDINDSYNWYDLADGGMMYQLSDLLEDGMYYAEAVNENGCLSLERFAVEVILDPDCDNDGVLDVEEFDGDTDNDGTVDYLDPDDDGDIILTIDEDNNSNGDWFDDDCDTDGIPDYLDPESCDLIPTGFSPGEVDGVNDTWEIPMLVAYPNYSLEVYDRFGNLVYDYKNAGNTSPQWWDGRSNGRWNFREGELLPAGTYFYIINFNQDEKQPQTGWVYLNR